MAVQRSHYLFIQFSIHQNLIPNLNLFERNIRNSTEPFVFLRGTETLKPKFSAKTMSATGSIVSYRYNLSSVFPETPRRPSNLNVNNRLNTSAPIHQQGFTAIRALFSGTIDRMVHSKSCKRNFVVHNSVQPGAPIPSGKPSNPWTSWLLGMLLSIALPFWRHGLTPLQALRKKVDTIVQTTELVVDVVEKVAEEVDKVADEVANKLPEGGLKAAAGLIGDIAEETAKDARIVGDLIDKVEEVQKEVESFFETVKNQENEAPKEASDSN